MSKSFDGILAHGCSNTHGTWHKYKHEYPTWPEVAGKLLKEKVVNIAQPGHSSQAVAYETINWCLKHGMPKRIFIGWPSVNRINSFKSFPEYDILPYDDIDTSLNESGNKFFRTKFHDVSDSQGLDETSFLFHQKIHAMLYVQYFCRANNIEYTYMSWDNIPWLLSDDYKSKLKERNYQSNEDYNPDQYLINGIDNDRHVFQNWVETTKAERKIFIWFWKQGILPHGEPNAKGIEDDHFGKEMHQMLGRVFYNFIKLKRLSDPYKLNEIQLEQGMNKLSKNSKIFKQLETLYFEYFGKEYRKIDDEPFFVYD